MLNKQNKFTVCREDCTALLMPWWDQGQCCIFRRIVRKWNFAFFWPKGQGWSPLPYSDSNAGLVCLHLRCLITPLVLLIRAGDLTSDYQIKTSPFPRGSLFQLASLGYSLHCNCNGLEPFLLNWWSVQFFAFHLSGLLRNGDRGGGHHHGELLHGCDATRAQHARHHPVLYSQRAEDRQCRQSSKQCCPLRLQAIAYIALH